MSENKIKIAVITVSDRASQGLYEDLSGPRIREILEESAIPVEVSGMIVPDEESKIRGSFEKLVADPVDYIITTGGTGISPRDVTPEVTRKFCDRELPGISEMLRWESYKETPFAVLSRGFCGIKGATIIVNFPGSVKAVSLCTRLLLPILEHGRRMLRGETH